MNGRQDVGLSTYTGYSFNERAMLSLGIVDVDAETGTEVTLVWGEEGGGSSKPTVERHAQAEIRAVVSPVPILRGCPHVLRRGRLEGGGSRALEHPATWGQTPPCGV